MALPGLKILTAATAAALLTAGFAYGQDGEPAFQLGGANVFPAQEFEPALTVSAPASLEDSQGEAEEGEGAEASLEVTQGPTQSALPWYERFTVSTPSEFRSAWGEEATEFQFSAGQRWGFTLGLAEQERGSQFDLEDMSAGAYYELSERFRVGTNLRFSSPTADVFGEQDEVNVPELKFESAFRF